MYSDFNEKIEKHYSSIIKIVLRYTTVPVCQLEYKVPFKVPNAICTMYIYVLVLVCNIYSDFK